MTRPLIGITTDVDGHRYQVAVPYAAAVRTAGGTPVLLPCEADCARDYLLRCDGVVLTGGDDPIMEQWGLPTHPEARKVDPRRQAFELAMLAAADVRDDRHVCAVDTERAR